MDPLSEQQHFFPPHASCASGLGSEEIRQSILREHFTFTTTSRSPSISNPVSVRCATAADLASIVEIQGKSPADFQIHLSTHQITELVHNQQVLVAEFQKDGAIVQAGAIFFTSSSHLTRYQDALNPAHYDAHGSHLYDFWIIVHKERATTSDGTSVSTSLIHASDALATGLGKDGVIAFSRAGGALPRFYRTLDQVVQENHGSIDTFLDFHPHYKAQLLINYIIGCETTTRRADSPRARESHQLERFGDIQELPPELSKEIRLEAILRWQKSARKGREVPNPQARHFVNWLRAEHPRIFDEKVLSLLERPDPQSDWNPLQNGAFAPLLGALLRKFCDQGSHQPVDPALGGLHTRLGARFHGIALNSRPDDHNALASNILMSYERVDINSLIERLTSEFHK